MSKVKIQGNASGTGVLTIEAPNTNTDRTITLPDSTGTLVGADANGNVGIGVVPESDLLSNTWNLQIGGGTSALISAESGVGNRVSFSGNAKKTGTNWTTGWEYQQSHEAATIGFFDGDIQFRVAPSGTADSAISWTTAMTIDNSGDVHLSGGTLLIDNSTNTTVGLGVDTSRGSMTCAAPNGNTNILVQTTTSVTGTHNLLYFMNTSTNVGAITTNGTSTSYSTSSDYRLKENVVPMTGSIDRLKQLKPSRFNFIADADTTVDGFLAHEAQAIVPEAITGEKDAMKMEEYEVTPAVMDGETVVTEAVMGEREVPDYQGIDQAKLVPLLTSALQDAIEKIEQLESRITAMEVS